MNKLFSVARITNTTEPKSVLRLHTNSMEHSPSSEANRLSASQEIPLILWTRKFITAFKNACHLSLSSATSIQHIPPSPLYEDPFQYYLTFYAWVFQVVPFPQVSPPKPCIHFCPPYMLHAPPISFCLSPE